jgi:GAF domain-containing protein
MTDAPSPDCDPPCDLESVIATTDLERRSSRPADYDAERRALLALTSELAEAPEDFFSKLVRYALELSNAESAGISLLNEEEGRFIWPAVAGKLESYLGAGTPSDFGPCGTVLDRRMALLFQHPERHFTYLSPIVPPLEEVLLIPFYLNQKPVGTIWAVIHETHGKFDAEDRRLLESLSTFAASAYRVLASTGELEPLLRMNAAPAH